MIYFKLTLNFCLSPYLRIIITYLQCTEKVGVTRLVLLKMLDFLIFAAVVVICLIVAIIYLYPVCI